MHRPRRARARSSASRGKRRSKAGCPWGHYSTDKATCRSRGLDAVINSVGVMSISMTAPLPAASVWRLALRQLVRDFRAGELRLLMVAVTLAVAALAAVGFFADRINHGLARDARQLLGGDAIISSDQPSAPAFAAKAREMGLTVATTAAFPSMGR